MSIVTNNNKTILKDCGIAPFTIERNGDRIILREYIKEMRLGLVSAKWLYYILSRLEVGYSQTELALEHDGRKILTILNENGYIYIIGTNIRFNFKRDVLIKLVDWLKENL